MRSEKLHLWRDETDLRAWLFTVLHNQHINHLRRTARGGAAVRLNERNRFSLVRRSKGDDLNCAILGVLANLPMDQRPVILLVGLEGMSYGEVAAVLDVPVGTIRSHLSRGRKAFTPVDRHLQHRSDGRSRKRDAPLRYRVEQ